MAGEKERPIIIKKTKKLAGGHHGGAWKLAYSDFVTAMMAFFLLMWLLGSTSEGDKGGIADYFINPWRPSLRGGRGDGDATSPIDGGGEDLRYTFGQVKKTNTGTFDKRIGTSSEELDGYFNSQRIGLGTNEITPGNEETIVKLDIANLKDAQQKLEQLIETDTKLHQYSGQFSIAITMEGLRVQILDEENRPMFDVGSTQMKEYAIEIMRKIAPIINRLPNHISIVGHTDARPYAGKNRGYSNWELSADRANSARRELVNSGVQENKFMRIVGIADSIPLDHGNPLNPINRRISIIIMNYTTERKLLENSGPVIEVGSDAHPPPPGVPNLQPNNLNPPISSPSGKKR